jgi:chemotaxis protein MotB
MKNLVLLLLLSLPMLGCVRSAVHDRLKSQYEANLSERDRANARADSLNKEFNKVSARTNELVKENTNLKTQISDVDSLYRRNKRLSDDLFNKYDRLEKTYNQLLANGNSELGKVSTSLSQREKELEATRGNLAEREARVKQLESAIAEKDRMVNSIRDKVTKALQSFKGTDLTVETRNGKVYVSLSEKLLFKSGSYNVDPRGVQALKDLSSALKNQPDLEIAVEGHTDDVPIAAGTAGMKDNWDLSVLRATSIVRVLTDAGVNPTQLRAAGKGKFQPVDPDKTALARQKNRRTEIILSPKLDELYRILGE